jgi:hypothetical protein
MEVRYKRVLLKLSGEAFAGDRGYGIDPNFLEYITAEIKSLVDEGVQLAVVIGGGNIFRGITGLEIGIDRATGDYMGMLATVINALALQSALGKAEGDSYPSALCHRNASSGGTIHKTKGNKASRKGQGGDLCCGHRKSLFLHRYCGCPQGCGNICPAFYKGYKDGWHIH